jgi:hypothetical protein
MPNANNPNDKLGISQRLAVRLMVISFALAVLSLVSGILFPTLLAVPLSRMLMVTLVSLCLATFFFVFFPGRVRIAQLPGVTVAVEVGGPLAVFFVTFMFLSHYLPRFPEGRLFYLRELSGERIENMPVDQVAINKIDEFEYHWVHTKDAPPKLVGVYIVFDPSKATQGYSANVSAPFRKPQKNSFAIVGLDSLFVGEKVAPSKGGTP